MLGLIWALVLFVGPVCFVHVNSQAVLEIHEGPNGAEFVMQDDGKVELRVDSSTNLKIACKVIGEDLLSVLWLSATPKTTGISFGQDLLITDTNKYSIDKVETDDGSDFVLGLYNLTLKDEGVYTCQAGDIVEMTLFVTTAPIITSITSLQTASAGDPVSLECIATGSPRPKIRWRHVRPTTQLPNGIEGSYKKGINLEITSIAVQDRGEYECIASNGVPNDDASAKKKTYIRMDYAPTVEAIVEENPVVRAPEGKPTSLTCKSMSYPRSSSGDVVWSFEDVDTSELGYIVTVDYELPSEAADLYEETTYSVLQVPEVNDNTTGQYKCQFTNTMGNGHALIQLDIGEQESGDTDGSVKGGTASALSSSIVTIATMMSAAILWLVH